MRKRNSLKLMVSGALAICALPMAMGNVVSVGASVTEVGETQTVSYDDVFKIPNASISSIKNNGGNYGSSNIAKAIDGNNKTHWETGKPNSATFKNKVSITFDKTYEIASMKYLVRQDGAKGKGFPKEYKIYVSTTETGDDFTLLKQATPTYTTDSLEINFEKPTQVRRIEFEFVEANQNWASMAEVSFYKYDALKQEFDQVFTDKTYSAVSEEYKSVEKINEMIALAEKHPDGDKYLTLLEDAKTLLTEEGAFDNKIFTASQRGNIEAEKKRTKTCSAMLTLDSTGYYVTPGETITVYVEADPNGIMPRLAFGQIGKGKSDWRRFFNLKPGINVITAQTQDKMNPAAIYLSNEALPSQQAYAPRVRIVGGKKFPLFELGKSNTEEFQAELQAYVEDVNYSDDAFGTDQAKDYNFNIAEFVTENTTITTSAAGALKEVNNIIKAGQTVEQHMENWEFFYDKFAEFSGYDMEDESSMNYRPRGKFMSRVFISGPFGWADYGYTGYNGGNSAKRDSGFFASMVRGVSGGGWATAHEWGHMFDSSQIGRSESTNNLYALLFQDIYTPGKNRMVSENRWNLHFTTYHNTKVYPDDQLFYGAITYQLYPMYGSDIYSKAQKIARENKDGIMNGLTSNNDRLVVAISLAVGADVSGHYEYYNQKVSDAAKAKIAHLQKPDKKTYYANDKSFTEDAIAFDTEVTPTLEVSGRDKVTIKLDVDQPDNAVLCYEIYRDGEFVGVTYNNTFVDKGVDQSKTYNYSAIVYDRKLNASNMSEQVTINLSEPNLYVRDTIGILKGSEFDAYAYATATNVGGEDITGAIQIEENTVNTNRIGEYKVVYGVTDAAGNYVRKEVKVYVFNSQTYLSDINWKEATQSWGRTNKDKSVSGKTLRLTENGEVTYKKGIGTHANSTIIYDLTGEEYKAFSSYIGVDREMAASKASSIVFKVYVDDALVYDSGTMRATDEQKYVYTSLEGAKELKLEVYNAGNGNNSDHANWADAQLYVIDEAVDYSILEDTISQAQALDMELYTEESKNNLIQALEAANEILANQNATQIEVDRVNSSLQEAIDKLEEKTLELGEVIEFAKQITDISYVKPGLAYRELKLSNLQTATKDADIIYANESTANKDIIKRVTSLLIYLIGETGQTYVAGGTPIQF